MTRSTLSHPALRVLISATLFPRVQLAPKPLVARPQRRHRFACVVFEREKKARVSRPRFQSLIRSRSRVFRRATDCARTFESSIVLISTLVSITLKTLLVAPSFEASTQCGGVRAHDSSYFFIASIVGDGGIRHQLFRNTTAPSGVAQNGR